MEFRTIFRQEKRKKADKGPFEGGSRGRINECQPADPPLLQEQQVEESVPRLRLITEQRHRIQGPAPGGSEERSTV